MNISETSRNLTALVIDDVTNKVKTESISARKRVLPGKKKINKVIIYRTVSL